MATQAVLCEARCGADASWTLTVADARGAPVGTYTEAATLSARVWPGGHYAAVLTPAVAWLSAPDGTVTLAIDGSDTADIEPGLYEVELSITSDSGTATRPVGMLRLTAAPGTAELPRTYCTFADMASLVPWIEDIEDLGPGLMAGVALNFLDARRDARIWLDDQILARARTAYLSQQRLQGPTAYAMSGAISTGADLGAAYGPSALPDGLVEDQIATLRTALDAADLALDTGATGRNARRIAASYAVYLALRHQPGKLSDGTTYMDLAKSFRTDALGLLLGARFTVGTGASQYLL